MQNFTDTYKELAELLADKTTVKWVDMWYDQLMNLEDEYPFPFPCAFIDLDIDTILALPDKVQELETEIGIYVAVETLEDTFQGSVNMDSALAFMSLLTEVHKVLQSKHGENFSTLNRTSLKPVSVPANIICYRMGYTTILRDYSAKPVKADIPAPAVTVEKGQKPADGSEKLYMVD